MPELHGTIHRQDTDSTIRMTFLLQASRARVWEAIIDPGLAARWMGSLTGRLEEGGDYQIVFDETEPTAIVAGHIQRCIPGEEVQVTWQAPGESLSVVTARLRPSGQHTLLLLVHSGVQGPSSDTGHAAGWQIHLEQLAAGLADEDWTDRWENWAPLQRAFEEALIQDTQ